MGNPVVFRTGVTVVLITAFATPGSSQNPTPNPAPTPVAATRASAQPNRGEVRQKPYIVTAKETSPAIDIPAGLSHPAGVAWDGRYLWVTDSRRGAPKMWKIDAGSSASPGSIALPRGLNPGVIALAGSEEAAWIVHDPVSRLERRTGAGGFSPVHDSSGKPVDLESPLIVKVSLVNGSIVSSLPLTPLAEPGPVTGLAVVGHYLWLSVGGGLCACVYLIDLADGGKVVSKFFPRCNPVALTVDAKSEYLLLAAERGEQEPVILERLLGGPRADSTSPVVPFHRTQRFHLLDKGVRPRAIAVVGKDVWVLDVGDPKDEEKSVIRRYGVR